MEQEHTTLVCLTQSGTGRNHFTQIVVGGQTSPVFLRNDVRYAPPFITHTSGEASPAASTPGSETLVLHGANLGESSLTLDRVSWGQSDGTQFEGVGCFILEAHTAIQCTTSEGAGRGLRIDVVVDSVQSAAPRTSYLPPQISAVSAPARGRGYSTRGGEPLVIDGRNFGNASKPVHKGLTLESITRQAIMDVALNTSDDPLSLMDGADEMHSLSLQQLSERSLASGGDGVSFTYLDSVALGPYILPASACNITAEHRQISCQTLQGVGGDHLAVVSVGGQDSQSAAGSTGQTQAAVSMDYAPPRLLAIQLRAASVLGVAIPPNENPATFEYAYNRVPTTGGVIRIVGQDIGRAVDGLVVSAATSPSNKQPVQKQYSEVPCDASTRIDADAFARVFADYFDPMPHSPAFAAWTAAVGGAGGAVAEPGSIAAGAEPALPIASASQDPDLYCADIIVPPADGKNRVIRAQVGGRTSNELRFSYADPFIREMIVVEDPDEPTSARRVLIIRGGNFGLGGRVLVAVREVSQDGSVSETNTTSSPAAIVADFDGLQPPAGGVPPSSDPPVVQCAVQSAAGTGSGAGDALSSNTQDPTFWTHTQVRCMLDMLPASMEPVQAGLVVLEQGIDGVLTEPLLFRQRSPVVVGFSPSSSPSQGGGKVSVTSRFLASRSSANRIGASIGPFECAVDPSSFEEL